MSEFLKQIYPPTKGEPTVSRSGELRRYSLESQSMNSETWAKLPDSVKYQIGVTGLMHPNASIDIITILGGVFTSYLEKPKYDVLFHNDGRERCFNEYSFKSGVVYSEVKTELTSKDGNDQYSITTVPKRPMGFSPIIIAVTPRDTSLQYIAVRELSKTIPMSTTTK